MGQERYTVCYTRNDKAFYQIPFKYEGEQHDSATGDHAKLRDGRALAIEVKGEEDDRDRAKYQAAKRWVSAVNNWGRQGAWLFHVCNDPQTLSGILAYLCK